MMDRLRRIRRRRVTMDRPWLIRAAAGRRMRPAQTALTEMHLPGKMMHQRQRRVDRLLCLDGGNGSNGVYVVEEGDTLAIISRKMYGDVSHVDAICRMNGITDGNLIYVGQKLLLP